MAAVAARFWRVRARVIVAYANPKDAFIRAWRRDVVYSLLVVGDLTDHLMAVGSQIAGPHPAHKRVGVARLPGFGFQYRRDFGKHERKA